MTHLEASLASTPIQPAGFLKFTLLFIGLAVAAGLLVGLALTTVLLAVGAHV